MRPLRPGHLRATRERLGLSQHQLGILAGCTRHPQPCVSLAETGKRHYDDIAMALLRVLEEKRAERWMERRRRLELAEDAVRIKRQEQLWNAVPDGPEKAALLDAMIDRCFDLMCEGAGAECDAIAEWLPADRVHAMFDEWEQWSDPEVYVDCEPCESGGDGGS